MSAVENYPILQVIMGRFKGKKDTGAANSSNLDLDPIKVLKRTSATVSMIYL